MRRALVLALALAAVVTTPALAQTVQITGNVTTNTTWGPTGTVVGTLFWVRNNISISPGVTLDIEPGVVVKFDPMTSLTVLGRLRAQGTLGNEIVVSSARDDNAGSDDTNGDGNASSPGPSDWVGIRIVDDATGASEIEYCDIRYAGFGSQGALFFDDVTGDVTNSTIRSSFYGIECRGGANPTITQTSIEASTQTPITLDFTAAPVLSALVFSSSDNGYDAFGLRGGSLSGSATLPVRGATVGVNAIANVTYVLLSSLHVTPGASLTIDPAVVIKPLGGGITVDGTLTMNGTSNDRITITSIHDDNVGQPLDTNNNGSLTAPAAGNWGNVSFNIGASGSLQNCRLRYGSGGLVQMLNASIPVSDCFLSDAAHGLVLNGTASPTVNTVEIRNTSSTPILMSASADPTLTNLTFVSNAVTALGIIGENLTVDARLYPRTVAGYSNITYYLLGSLTMASPAVLRVDPGVVVKLFNGSGLEIDGSLIADGKPDSLIVFTSEKDDAYGNPADTNGDGSITSPNSGNWASIHFNPTSDDMTGRLDYCRITYGSYNLAIPIGGLWITSAAPLVTNCTIFESTYGVRIDGNATPTIDDCTITNCDQAPFLMSVLADPTLTDNTFATNGYNAIALLSETLSQNATLEYRPGVGSPPFAYAPTGTITVGTGVTLAVEPSVVIKPISTGTVFSVNGALNMVGGTGSQRIVLTSIADDTHAGDTNADGSASSPGSNEAGVIQFNNTSVDAACIIRNCLIQFGGSGVIRTSSASPRIARTEFFENPTVLLAEGTSQPSLDSLTVLNCDDVPFKMSLLSDPVFGNTITLANNAFTAIGILGESHSTDVRLGLRSLPGIPNVTYLLTGGMNIAFGATWRIDPGLVIKMSSGFSIDGALVADGKPESLIVFTSIKDDTYGGDTNNDGALTQPAPGNWSTIVFGSVSNDAGTVIDHCRFRYGGDAFTSGQGAMEFVNAGPTLTNCLFTSSAGHAVRIEGNSTPTFTSCAFENGTGSPVILSLVSAPVFNSVTFSGNARTALSVIPETLAQDVLWPIRAVAGRQNMPYLVEGALVSGLGSTLTLQPGLIVKFDGGGSIAVQRAFVAEGRTPRDSMIVFTSLTDDFHGGDTNNDGATSPFPGSWQGVSIEGTSIDAQVRFRNCVFRYGGSGSTIGGLRVTNASPSVDSCLFAYNTVGISATGTSDPTIRGCSFVGNTDYGVNNLTASFCIDAEGNWWGAASGPNDASAASDLCGLGSNAGSGNAVSNNVDYDPWVTAGTLEPMLGDVSLNGEIRAFDASLVLQHVVSPMLSALQQLVADVSGAGGITAFDASLILQYVAGTLQAFPAASTAAGKAPPEVLAARRIVEQAHGDFTLALGTPRREGDAWLVPVIATGTAPIYSIELRLEGGSAASLQSVAAGAALVHHAAAPGVARVAAAATQPIGAGEAMTLRYAADGAEAWSPPALAWGRVNEDEIEPTLDTEGAIPAASFLRAPTPNPASGPVAITLGLAARHAGPAVVRVLDLAGRRVRTVADGSLPGGSHVLTWDLRDDHGHLVPAGIYLVHAEAGGARFTRRLAVVR